MNQLINSNKKSIEKACLEHNVRHLYAFGSVLTEKFNKESDIDFIVDFQNVSLQNHADNYFDLKYLLQEILERNIDLLEEKAIKNPYFKNVVFLQMQKVYGN